jgi:hypothetical protein
MQAESGRISANASATSAGATAQNAATNATHYANADARDLYLAQNTVSQDAFNNNYKVKTYNDTIDTTNASNSVKPYQDLFTNTNTLLTTGNSLQQTQNSKDYNTLIASNSANANNAAAVSAVARVLSPTINGVVTSGLNSVKDWWNTTSATSDPALTGTPPVYVPPGLDLVDNDAHT